MAAAEFGRRVALTIPAKRLTAPALDLFLKTTGLRLSQL